MLALVFPAAAAEQSVQNEITIAAVGDLMLGGRAEPLLKEFGADYPFTDVMSFLCSRPTWSSEILKVSDLHPGHRRGEQEVHAPRRADRRSGA